MSIFNINDFSQNFDRDFGRDADTVINSLNDALIKLDQRYRGPFDIIIQDINNNNLAPKLADKLYAILEELVIRNRGYLNDVLRDAIDALLLTEAKVIMDTDQSIGDNQTYDFVCSELNRNPLLDKGRDPRGRDNRGGARDDRRYNSRREEPRNSGRGNEPRRPYVQPHQGSATAGYRGRMVPQDKLAQQQAQQQAISHHQPSTQVSQPACVGNGTVITADNLAITKFTVSPLYILGDEHVVYSSEEDKLVVKEITAGDKVDYDKHRVDTIFPNLLGVTDTEVFRLRTMAAIEATQKAMSNRIDSYIDSIPENEGDEVELVADSKMLKVQESLRINEPFYTYSTKRDYIDIRDGVLSQHGGDDTWSRKNALIVSNKQVMLFGTNNDLLAQVRNFVNNSDTLADRVKSLIGLASVLEAAKWKEIHDYITKRVNFVLTAVLNQPVRIDSITADWNDLAQHLKTLPQSDVLLLSNEAMKLLNNVEVTRTEVNGQPELGEVNQFVTNEVVVYLPVAGYEFAYGSASQQIGVMDITPDNKMYPVILALLDDIDIDTIVFVTLDGIVFEVIKSLSIDKPRLTIITK